MILTGKSFIRLPLFSRKVRVITGLAGVVLCAPFFQASAAAFGSHVSISKNRISLKKAVLETARQEDYNYTSHSEKVSGESSQITLKDKENGSAGVSNKTFIPQSQIYSILAYKFTRNLNTDKSAGGILPQTQITGEVKDSLTGQPMVGVTVQVKGITTGTTTDVNGQFVLEVPENGTLIISFLGYKSKEVPIEGRSKVNILMSSATNGLNEIVVTALGVKKSQASLSYSTQEISGSDLTKVKTDNMINALSGKVAGLTISPSAGGIGGSAKVILRGERSANGNNQPLYVIDGVPITNGGNSNGQGNSLYGGTPDGGDGIANLNPDDIASISVLEGAAAAALYGSQAQNGVILITTKKGKAGKTTIHYSSSFSVQRAAYEPPVQNKYGPTTPGSNLSWGSPISGSPDVLNEFLQTGTNWTNSVSLSAGSDKAETYFSYANTKANGIEPVNTLKRNNFFLHETGHFLNDKLTVDGSVMYVNQKINNSPAIGFYLNPLVGLYLFPRGQSILPYKQQYEFTDSSGIKRQNWFVYGDDMHQMNPWWIINRDVNSTVRNRVIMTGSVKYDFTNWLNLQVRGNMDKATDNYEYRRYAGTDPLFNSNGNGAMEQAEQTVTQKYGDALLTIADPNQGSKFQIGGFIGASINDQVTNGWTMSGNLSTPDFFSTANIIAALPSASTTIGAMVPNFTHTQLQSVFANANVSYSDWIYLTLTGRNDWSSNLAFTPTTSFFYPSAGFSFILSRVIHLPQAVSYAKLRGTFAQVGNTVPAYMTNVQNTLNTAGQLTINTNASFSTLKPEKTNSFEVGTDWSFLGNRVHFSFTYYKTNTLNQFIPVTPPVASLISTGYVNAGNIQNTGINFIAGADIIKSSSFTWSVGINGSLNRNKIIDVDSKDSINQFILTGAAGNSYESMIRKGGSYGDIYGTTFQKNNQGQIIFAGSGTSADPYVPVANSQFGYLGNPNPKFQLGWSNTFTYKNFSLYFLLSGRFGGQVLSLTQLEMDLYGVSAASGEARAAGGVKVNGVDENGKPVTEVDPKSWYSTIGGRAGITEAGMYSAAVVRLREASLGYTFPLKHSVFQNLRLSLIGRNLIYFYKPAPFDPELAMSTGNGLAGVDLFDQPATRYMGINLNVTF